MSGYVLDARTGLARMKYIELLSAGIHGISGSRCDMSNIGVY